MVARLCCVVFDEAHYTVPCLTAGNRSDVSSLENYTDEDEDDPNGNDGPRLIKVPYCKLVDHIWEYCVGEKYVKPNGVLFRRSCLRCTAKFQTGSQIKAIGKGTKRPKDKYWVTKTNTVAHCTQCRVCLCRECHGPFLEDQGLLSDTRSPRKAKKTNMYSA